MEIAKGNLKPNWRAWIRILYIKIKNRSEERRFLLGYNLFRSSFKYLPFTLSAGIVAKRKFFGSCASN